MTPPPDRPAHAGATDRIADGDPRLPAQPVLVVVAGGTATAHPLPAAGNLTIGRAPDSDVRIDDGSISRKHAVLRIAAPMSIEDLGSANGTRVRTVRLEPGRPVTFGPGEVVNLGSVIAIVQSDPSAARPWRLWSHGYFEDRLENLCAAPLGELAVLRVRTESPTDHLAEVVGEVVRPGDLAAAWGPAEIELLVTGRDEPRAESTAAEIQQRLQRRGVVAQVGIARWPRDGRSAQALIAAAGSAWRTAEPAARPGEGIVVADEAMRRLYDLVARVAPGTIGVLLTGETGVGTEVVAEAVHRLSPRAARPLLRLNCAALSETLLESELFGHDRGAFTGAVQAKPGLLETADGGTILLDEVGELPLATQAKLLRVLEERQVLRVGGLTPRAIDVRFVAATNRDLEAEVRRGAFRQDLLFRLNGVTLTVPPLRERVSEIEPMARAFLHATCHRLARSREPGLSAEAVTFLCTYDWPGNVRELRNVIERAVLLCDEPLIGLDHLPTEKRSATLSASRPPPAPVLPQSSAPEALRKDLQDVEKQHILDALAQCGGNQTQAAKLLGISRRTLTSRLTDYGVPRPRKGR